MLTITVECVQAQSHREDAYVEGTYHVNFGFDEATLTKERQAEIALDIFHSTVCIKVLDDFEITVLDSAMQPIDPTETDGPRYEYRGDVEKISSELVNEISLTAEEVLDDPGSSEWLKDALTTAMGRDPIDAVNDASVLVCLLRVRAQSFLRVGVETAGQSE